MTNIQHDAEITCQYLKQLIDKGADLVLIDVRKDWEVETCMIGGSQPIPLHLLSEHTDEVPTDKHVVTICHHGVRSLKARDILVKAGGTQVQSLKGGIDAWAIEIDQGMARY